MIAYHHNISAATMTQQLMALITHFTPVSLIHKCDVWLHHLNFLSDDFFDCFDSPHTVLPVQMEWYYCCFLTRRKGTRLQSKHGPLTVMELPLGPEAVVHSLCCHYMSQAKWRISSVLLHVIAIGLLGTVLSINPSVDRQRIHQELFQ